MEQHSSVVIQSITAKLAPSSILLLQETASSTLSQQLAQSKNTKLNIVHSSDALLDNIKKRGLHELAIFLYPLNWCKKEDAINCISALRDIYCRHLLLLNNAEPSGKQLPQHDLIALGLNELDLGKSNEHLFEYNILNYKQTPDWLNAKNWANPELYDKYRW